MPDAIFYVDADSSELVDVIRISNYAQGSPGKPYPRAINYVLEMKLVYQNGDTYTAFSDYTLIGERYVKVKINGGTDVVFGYNAETNAYENVASAYVQNMSLAGSSPETDTLRVEYSLNQKALLTNPDPNKPKLYQED